MVTLNEIKKIEKTIKDSPKKNKDLTKFYDNQFFYDTKTVNIYKLLIEKKENQEIQTFSFDSFFISEENQKIFTIESITVDGIIFENPIDATTPLRADLKFFFFLNNYLKDGLIQSFELLKYNTSNRKYNAKKTNVDGFKFDSRQEVYFYIHLLLKKKNKEILNFSLNPKFTLQEGFEKINHVNGKTKKFPPLKYIADFEILHLNNFLEIVDVKGVLTDEFSIKRKLFEFKFPDLTLSILKQKKENSLDFIDLDEYESEKKKRKKTKKENTISEIK